jgi:hypothetical protein
MPSTLTVQSVVNLASTHIDLLPIAGVGGYTNEPALSIANDVLQTIAASTYEAPNGAVLSLDWKWNRVEMGMFVTCPNRQDYLFAGATIFNIGGNAQGAGIDLTTNSALTISGTTVTIKTLEQYNGAVGDVCYIRGTGSNYDSTFTNNGTAVAFGGCTYTLTNISGLTLTATVSGGSPSGTSGSAGITDFGWLAGVTMVGLVNGGPILPTRHPQAVRDIQPFGFANIPEEWCVFDQQNGILKLRCRPVAGTTTWGVNCVYQKKATILTSLANTWAPVPDELGYLVRQGFLTHAYRYVNSPKSEAEEMKFYNTLRRALGADEREQPDIGLVPAEGIRTSDWDVQILF